MTTADTYTMEGEFFRILRTKAVLLLVLILVPGMVRAADVEILHREAVEAVKSGRTEEAVELLSRCIAQDPDNSRFYNDRGVALKRLGRLDEALSDYSKALAIRSDDVNALNNRGVVYIKQGKYAEAVEDFTRALAQGGMKSKLYTNRGLAYALWGKEIKAAQDFKTAISHKPVDFRAFTYSAKLLEKRGRIEEALGMYGLAADQVEKRKNRVAIEQEIARLRSVRSQPVLEYESPGEPKPRVTRRQVQRVEPKKPPKPRVEKQVKVSKAGKPKADAAREEDAQANLPSVRKPPPSVPMPKSLVELNSRTEKKALEKLSPVAREIRDSARELLRKKETNKALVRLEDVLQLAKREDNRFGMAWTMLEIGRTYSLLGEHTRAATYFVKSFRLFNKLESGPERLLALAELANADRAAGLTSRASQIFAKAGELAEQEGLTRVAEDIRTIGNKEGSFSVAVRSVADAPKPAAEKDRPVPESVKRQMEHLKRFGKGPGSDLPPKKKTQARIAKRSSDKRYHWGAPTSSQSSDGGSAGDDATTASTEKESPQPKVEKATASRIGRIPPDVGRPKSMALRDDPRRSTIDREIKRRIDRAEKRKQSRKPKESIDDLLAKLRRLKAADDKPAMIPVLEKLAARYAKRKQYEKVLHSLTAAQAYRAGLGMTREKGESIRMLGLVKEKLGREAEALEDYSRAFFLFREQRDNIMRERVRVRMDRLAKQLHPTPHKLLEVLGTLWKARSRGDSAGETRALYDAAMLYDSADKPAIAITYLDRAMASMRTERARLYRKTGRHDRARQEFSRALQAFKDLDYSRYLQLIRQPKVAGANFENEKISPAGPATAHQ